MLVVLQTIPAHGKSSVEVLYRPSNNTLRVLGSEPCAYALGHISIDQQVIVVSMCGFVLAYCPASS